MDDRFNVWINSLVYQDIQKAVDFYNDQSQGNELGKRFVKTVKETLTKLRQSALHYRVAVAEPFQQR